MIKPPRDALTHLYIHDHRDPGSAVGLDRARPRLTLAEPVERTTGVEPA